MTCETTFAARLRWWREHRGLAQLALAGRAGISQRHLSFLELGRASPSREMVDRLAVALHIPLRQHNALLLAAGFAPEWRQSDLAGPDLADALVAPDVLRPYLVNWPEVVRHFIRSVEADAAADGLIETTALLERLIAYKGVRAALALRSNEAGAGPVLAMHFRKKDTSLRLFTTIATLGTPQDVTLQELRIECFFPMDEATAKLLRSWAKAPRRARSAPRA